MTTFFSPDGNPEVWENKPEGYFTEDEWFELNPPEVPEPELYEAAFSPEPDIGSRIDALEDVLLALLKGEIHV